MKLIFFIFVTQAGMQVVIDLNRICPELQHSAPPDGRRVEFSALRWAKQRLGKAAVELIMRGEKKRSSTDPLAT
jgi:hypothetical protein